MSNFIATFFYVGHLRPAPGTWGSLAALPAAAILYALGGPYAVVVALAVVYALGLWATTVETTGQDDHDPSEIVIDEVAGQWIAVLPVLFGAAANETSLSALWPGWVAAFVLFRFFDITKLGPVGWADRRGDATGVMLDDVIAGFFAAVGVTLLAALYHMVLV
ncbi:MAG: phosphatidylglycerophosphatase A [Pseudomonadota bacterium]